VLLCVPCAFRAPQLAEFRWRQSGLSLPPRQSARTARALSSEIAPAERQSFARFAVAFSRDINPGLIVHDRFVNYPAALSGIVEFAREYFRHNSDHRFDTHGKAASRPEATYPGTPVSRIFALHTAAPSASNFVGLIPCAVGVRIYSSTNMTNRGTRVERAQPYHWSPSFPPRLHVRVGKRLCSFTGTSLCSNNLLDQDDRIPRVNRPLCNRRRPTPKTHIRVSPRRESSCLRLHLMPSNSCILPPCCATISLPFHAQTLQEFLPRHALQFIIDIIAPQMRIDLRRLFESPINVALIRGNINFITEISMCRRQNINQPTTRCFSSNRMASVRLQSALSSPN